MKDIYKSVRLDNLMGTLLKKMKDKSQKNDNTKAPPDKGKKFELNTFLYNTNLPNLQKGVS